MKEFTILIKSLCYSLIAIGSLEIESAAAADYNARPNRGNFLVRVDTNECIKRLLTGLNTSVVKEGFIHGYKGANVDELQSFPNGEVMTEGFHINEFIAEIERELKKGFKIEKPN